MTGRPRMTGRRVGVALAVLSCLLAVALVTPTLAFAEGFADLFLGASFTQNGDVDVNLGGVDLFGTDQKYKTSLLVGGRAGWWLEPGGAGALGFNLDVSWFRPEFDDLDKFSVAGVDPLIGPFSASGKTDLNVVGIGFNAMLRGQFLKDNQVPQGRLQPYLFGGPTLFISTLDVKATATALGVTTSVDDSDTSAKVGVTAGAGLTYMFTKNLGLFGEYRFTHNKPEFELKDLGLKIEPTFNTHHLLGGLAVRF